MFKIVFSSSVILKQQQWKTAKLYNHFFYVSILSKFMHIKETQETKYKISKIEKYHLIRG